MTGPVILDGHGLTCEDVAAVARGGARVEPAPQVAARLERDRAAVDTAVDTAVAAAAATHGPA